MSGGEFLYRICINRLFYNRQGSMEWIWIVAAACVAFYLWRRSQLPQKSVQRQSTEIGMNMTSDRELMLSTFRRELANYMVRIDPDRFLRFYGKARDAEAAIDKAGNDERNAWLTIITKKYPMYADFDLVATRGHVLYADALERYPIDDIEEHYLNLVKFHALQRALNPDWEYRSAATTDEDLEHLRAYVQKIKDTRFRQRLTAAVGDFFTHRTSTRLDVPDGGLAYETELIAVYYLPSMPDNRAGFHFKDTEEFGIYSSFYDGERDKNYESYYRSDRKFEAQSPLDHLRIEEQI